VFAVILLGIGLYYHFRVLSPIAIGDAVGSFYHDPHPQVTFTATREESTHQPMYLIELKGNFTANNFHTNTIAFSVLGNGTYLWSMTAKHGNRIVYNFPGVPPYWGYFIFAPLSHAMNWGY
jgi:hypothetical protein